MNSKNPTSVQSVERGLTILEALSSEDGGLGVSELAKRTRLPASTVHRLLSVFVKRGYIDRGKTGCSYRLNTRFLELGFLPAGLFCEIYQLVSKHFVDKLADGKIGEIFVKIASRTLVVRGDHPSGGSGIMLVPEIMESSPRKCNAGNGSPGGSGCRCSRKEHREKTGYRYSRTDNEWCACLPADIELDGAVIDSMGAWGGESVGKGDVETIVSDLRVLRDELVIRVSLGKRV